MLSATVRAASDVQFYLLVEGRQPAGTYQLESEEEQIEGLSFSAFRRMTMTLFLPANPAPGATRYVVQVDPRELSEALLADAD